MKKNSIKTIAAIVAILTLVACGKEHNLPNNDEPASLWPKKKVSRIIQRAGTMDYLTYDFTWREGLLADIRCTLYDGTPLGGVEFSYDACRLQCITPYDGSDVRFPYGSMHYHYDGNGRLQRQTFNLPLREGQGLCDTGYTAVLPCELSYTYAADGKVSEVCATRFLPDGSTTSGTYTFTWQGGNVATLALNTDGGTQMLLDHPQYDTLPNPLRFPFGVETMGIGQTMILEGVFGYCITFLPDAFCWCENNMTVLPFVSGQCSLAYDDEGYLTSKTVTVGTTQSTYLFYY